MNKSVFLIYDRIDRIFCFQQVPLRLSSWAQNYVHSDIGSLQTTEANENIITHQNSTPKALNEAMTSKAYGLIIISNTSWVIFMTL